MQFKAPKRVGVAVAAGIVAMLVGISVIFGAARDDAVPKEAPVLELGPDMVQLEPGASSSRTLPAPDTNPSTRPDLSATASSASFGGSEPNAVVFRDDSLSFAATLPPGDIDDPVLAYLRKDAERYLARVKVNARADYDRLKREDVEPGAWEVKISWNYTGNAGDLVSLAGEARENTGGAHPILFFDTHIARRGSGKEIDFSDLLLRERSPSPAMTIAICEALKAAKMQTIHSATIFDEPIVCIGPEANAKTEAAAVALAPSDKAGAFGGVYVYYAPYTVGSHAEGPYRLTIQQAVFME
ncbi:MAG: hypothetical protein SGJ21_05935, partial [Alphaproteobacteria bacterium]|nr:hypothetical protein [Alphaproteobacteria bacterium]